MPLDQSTLDTLKNNVILCGVVAVLGTVLGSASLVLAAQGSTVGAVCAAINFTIAGIMWSFCALPRLLERTKH